MSNQSHFSNKEMKKYTKRHKDGEIEHLEISFDGKSSQRMKAHLIQTNQEEYQLRNTQPHKSSWMKQKPKKSQKKNKKRNKTDFWDRTMKNYSEYKQRLENTAANAQPNQVNQKAGIHQSLRQLKHNLNQRPSNIFKLRSGQLSSSKKSNRSPKDYQMKQTESEPFDEYHQSMDKIVSQSVKLGSIQLLKEAGRRKIPIFSGAKTQRNQESSLKLAKVYSSEYKRPQSESYSKVVLNQRSVSTRRLKDNVFQNSDFQGGESNFLKTVDVGSLGNSSLPQPENFFDYEKRSQKSRQMESSHQQSVGSAYSIKRPSLKSIADGVEAMREDDGNEGSSFEKENLAPSQVDSRLSGSLSQRENSASKKKKNSNFRGGNDVGRPQSKTFIEPLSQLNHEEDQNQRNQMKRSKQVNFVEESRKTNPYQQQSSREVDYSNGDPGQKNNKTKESCDLGSEISENQLGAGLREALNQAFSSLSRHKDDIVSSSNQFSDTLFNKMPGILGSGVQLSHSKDPSTQVTSTPSIPKLSVKKTSNKAQAVLSSMKTNQYSGNTEFKELVRLLNNEEKKRADLNMKLKIVNNLCNGSKSKNYMESLKTQVQRMRVKRDDWKNLEEIRRKKLEDLKRKVKEEREKRFEMIDKLEALQSKSDIFEGLQNEIDLGAKHIKMMRQKHEKNKNLITLETNMVMREHETKLRKECELQAMEMAFNLEEHDSDSKVLAMKQKIKSLKEKIFEVTNSTMGLLINYKDLG